MTHFARINLVSKVDKVIVAEQSFIDSLPDKDKWIETQKENGSFAGIGFTYDKENNVFYPQSPFPSWSISAPDWKWEPPVPCPADGKNYRWVEPLRTWVEETGFKKNNV